MRRLSAALFVLLLVAACTASEPDNTSDEAAPVIAEATAPPATNDTAQGDEAVPAGDSDAVTTALSSWAATHEVVGAVALVADSTSITSAVSGLRAVDGSDPIATADRFAIASLTKPFTAVLVLQLVERGTLSLDDPASTYLPSAPANVTIEQLLSHRSGYVDRDVESQLIAAIVDPSEAPTTDEQIEAVLGRGPSLPPDSVERYASVNYLLLHGVIEAATTRDYESLVQENILQPLGLDATGFDPDMASAPSPHERTGLGQPAANLGDLGTERVVRETGAAGALRSTVRDLHVFTTALFAGDLLTADSLALMLEAGLGLQRYPSAPADVFGHNGRTVGYTASLRHDPAQDLTVIVLSNDGAAPTDRAATELLELSSVTE